MIRTKVISRHFNLLPEIKRLYMASFPKCERDPFNGLVDHPANLDFKACFEGEELVGLYATLNEGDITHVLFLAVEEKARDKGYGSEILQEICSTYSHRRIFVDIEDPDVSSDNKENRIRRKHFYLHNGFQDTGIRYVWRGMPYQILMIGGTITNEEFTTFWNNYEE